MLYPEEFLQELDKQRNQIIYAKAIALTFDELPLETIEGQITSGSISIDGASAIRRTCSLSFVSTDINLTNYYWSINTKIKLFIGVKNYVNKNYQEIIWFN
jgi:hypothetical protein